MGTTDRAPAPINHALATIARSLAPINQASVGWIAIQAAGVATETAANDSTARSQAGPGVSTRSDSDGIDTQVSL